MVADDPVDCSIRSTRRGGAGDVALPDPRPRKDCQADPNLYSGKDPSRFLVPEISLPLWSIIA
jgi:hypothetical protein